METTKQTTKEAAAAGAAALATAEEIWIAAARDLQVARRQRLISAETYRAGLLDLIDAGAPLQVVSTGTRTSTSTVHQHVTIARDARTNQR